MEGMIQGKKSSYMEIRIHVIEMKSQIFRPILLGHSSLTMKRENRESYLEGMREERAFDALFFLVVVYRDRGPRELISLFWWS